MRTSPASVRACTHGLRPSVPRIPDTLRQQLPGLVARGVPDHRIAQRWGVMVSQVTGLRVRMGLRNAAGWPVSDAELRRLVVEEALTDEEIGERFGVKPRTVEVRRLVLGLRRSHDPRPEARRVIVLDDAGMREEPTPIQRAMAVLGGRVTAGRHGAYMLDGRPVSVVAVLRAGGVVAA